MFANSLSTSEDSKLDDLMEMFNRFSDHTIDRLYIPNGFTDLLTQPQSLFDVSLFEVTQLDDLLSPFNSVNFDTSTPIKFPSLESLDVTKTLVSPGTFQWNLGSLGTQFFGNFDRLFNDPIEYGNPLGDAVYWRQQQGDFSCAVVAQIGVFASLTGQYIAEADASRYAQQRGWFDPLTGTPLAHVGKILNDLGIATYQQVDATLSSLEQALAKGDKPIVGLDGNEIWNPLYDQYGNPLEQANAGHAVWVTGIDYELNGSIGVVVNDSGIGRGMASMIDYYDFMNAWQDYGYFVSVADNPFG